MADAQDRHRYQQRRRASPCSSTDGSTWGGGGGGGWRTWDKRDRTAGNRASLGSPQPTNTLGCSLVANGKSRPHSPERSDRVPKSRSEWSLWYRWVGERSGGGPRQGQEDEGRASCLPMSTLMASGSSPVKNFRLEIDALKVRRLGGEHPKPSGFTISWEVGGKWGCWIGEGVRGM